MSYTFTSEDEVFTARTVPGAARVRIFHQKTNSFIAAFDPDVPSLQGNQPKGSWVDVLPSTDTAWLKKVEPDIIKACVDRLISIQGANQKNFKKTPAMKCPKCGSSSVAKIMYGLPDFSNKELEKKVDAGKISFGGCLIFGDEKQPTKKCNVCENEWGYEYI